MFNETYYNGLIEFLLSYLKFDVVSTIYNIISIINPLAEYNTIYKENVYLFIKKYYFGVNINYRGCLYPCLPNIDEIYLSIWNGWLYIAVCQIFIIKLILIIILKIICAWCIYTSNSFINGLTPGIELMYSGVNQLIIDVSL